MATVPEIFVPAEGPLVPAHEGNGPLVRVHAIRSRLLKEVRKCLEQHPDDPRVQGALCDLEGNGTGNGEHTRHLTALAIALADDPRLRDSIMTKVAFLEKLDQSNRPQVREIREKRKLPRRGQRKPKSQPHDDSGPPSASEDINAELPLATYFREVRETPLLTEEEERKLGRDIARADAAVLQLAQFLRNQPLRAMNGQDQMLPQRMGPGELADLLEEWKAIRSQLILASSVVADPERVEDLRSKARIIRGGLVALNRSARAAPEHEHEDIREFLDTIQRGEEARDHLARANLRFVVSMARMLNFGTLSFADRIEEGNLGLLRAVEGYDPGRKRFTTYARYWIRQSIRRASQESGSVRIPSYIQELIAEYQRTCSQMNNQEGRTPSFAEVCAHMKLPRRRRTALAKAFATKDIRSIDYHLEENLHTSYLDEASTDTAADPPAAPQECAGDLEDLARIRTALSQLDQREQTILTSRFGLNGETPQMLKQIGLTLGFTREYIRQIEKKAILKIRESLGVQLDV